MSLAENNPNESHKQGANNICQIVLNFVPLDSKNLVDSLNLDVQAVFLFLYISQVE